MNSLKNLAPLKSNLTIGFLGDGQLARMSCLEAHNLGIGTAVFGSDKNAPAAQVTSSFVEGKESDFEKLVSFAKQVDVLTLENEFYSAATLQRLEECSGTPIYPRPASFALVESKLAEKKFFQALDIPVTPFVEIKTEHDLKVAEEKFGLPFFLKFSKGAYDGKGTMRITALEKALEIFRQSRATLAASAPAPEIFIEGSLEGAREFSVLVVQNDEQQKTYPVVESLQVHNICYEVIAPAEISTDLAGKMQDYAKRAMAKLATRGIFAFEFFVTPKGEIYLNESAPRPHNSGHFSMNGALTSQFANHVRAVANLPLGETNLIAPVASMVNVFGLKNGVADYAWAPDLLKLPGTWLHLYGKAQEKLGRKMGHINVISGTRQEDEAKRLCIKKLVHQKNIHGSLQ